jgi:hypothetical protein
MSPLTLFLAGLALVLLGSFFWGVLKVAAGAGEGEEHP